MDTGGELGVLHVAVATPPAGREQSGPYPSGHRCARLSAAIRHQYLDGWRAGDRGISIFLCISCMRDAAGVARKRSEGAVLAPRRQDCTLASFLRGGEGGRREGKRGKQERLVHGKTLACGC